MSSILGCLDMVQQALAAQQYALSISQRNVANASVPYYTRQDATFFPMGGGDSASGIPGVSLQAVRDRFIDYSISQELQSLAKYDVTHEALQQIDAIFNGTGGQNLQQALSAFFNSFDSLAGLPEDLTLRQQVLESANALAFEFRRISSAVQRVQTDQDQAMKLTVEEANSLTAKIADLNQKVLIAHGLNSEDEFVLRDARQQTMEQLASLMDLSYFETESGSITVTTRQGIPLVIGDEAHTLELGPRAGESYQGVSLGGSDITASIQGGKLGGLIDVRDNKIAGYLASLDDMAAGIISRVNEQHAQGTDLDGQVGGNFFTPFSPLTAGVNTGAARIMSVMISDPRRIAAAETGSGPGNNANAKRIADISNEMLFSSDTATVTQFHAGLIFRIGSDEKVAEEGLITQGNVLDQLKNQRDAFSGVNLDEEAISIVKYQKAYQASARFANILDSLSNEILQLLGA